MTDLIIAAAAVGSILTVIFLTKFELLAETITLALKTILKVVWLIISSIFELVKAVLQLIFITIPIKIKDIFFPPSPPPGANANDNFPPP